MTSNKTDFYREISGNKRKTVVLVIGAFVFLGALGYAIGYIFYGPAEAVFWMGIGLVIATVQSVFSLRYGDRLVLASTHARPVTPQENPRLHNLVEGIAIAAGIPKPAIYIVPEMAPNAFATGRDPEHASIAVTQGLLDTMNRVELEGVVAHEMSHIQDRDMLVGTIVATLVGAVVLMSEFFLRFWFIGGRGRGGRGGGGGDAGGAVQLVLLVIGLALIILAPIFAQIIKMAVSRNREYLADANGVRLTRYPPGLLSALKKIAVAPHAMRSANNATAHLWLDQPSRVEGERISMMEKLFSTHPPIQERIRILEEM